jgi:hypothetical protein
VRVNVDIWYYPSLLSLLQDESFGMNPTRGEKIGLVIASE